MIPMPPRVIVALPQSKKTRHTCRAETGATGGAGGAMTAGAGGGPTRSTARATRVWVLQPALYLTAGAAGPRPGGEARVEFRTDRRKPGCLVGLVFEQTPSRLAAEVKCLRSRIADRHRRCERNAGARGQCDPRRHQLFPSASTKLPGYCP